MKRLFFLLLALSAAAHAQPQDPSVAAEHARLKSEREKAEAVFRAEEKACYGKFAVNDCIGAARAKRRAVVADLRRQEIALNDAERKRKAAERRHEIDEKEAQQRERAAAAAARTASAPASATQPALRAAAKPAARAAPRAASGDASAKAANAAKREQAISTRKAEQAAARQRRDEEAARNVKDHERRLAEAKEREERLRKRLAERKKPPASALKDPS